ncbi:MAG: LysM peptidoglycan-binding domain-containing protein [Acidimicrobiales bacterium]
MVALLTSDPIFALPLRPDELSEAPLARRSRPRHLHAVPAPKPAPGAMSPGADAGSSAAQTNSAAPILSSTEITGLAVVVVLAVIFVGSFASIQAPPAQSTWAEVNGSSVVVAPADAGERVLLVKPGDTLWGIAGRLAPDADRREVVQILADRNGGSTIWAGQGLVIPSSLSNL